MKRKTRIIANSGFWSDGIKLFISQRGMWGPPVYLKEMVFESVEEGMEPPWQPPVLDATEAQELMDSLWSCGIRPTDGAGTAGSMRAVENHLRDMRAIVASKLKVEF